MRRCLLATRANPAVNHDDSLAARPHKRLTAVALILAVVFCSATTNARGGNPLNLLPTPKSLKVEGERMPLTAEGRIVATDPTLKPLAEILSREILVLTKFRLAPAEGEAKAGDIVLKINPQLRADADILTVQNREVKKVRDYAHTINVSDTAVVEGWDYRAACEGTATLLQAIVEDGGKFFVPRMTVKDWPHADYCGYMIDCARQGLPLMGVRDAIEAMRFFKVRYLHLHFHDGSAFYFPLKAYPQAGNSNGAINNGDAFKSWDLEELKKTVAYADARGVTLVPELETPGHCEGLLADLKTPDGKYLLGDPGSRLMDIANDDIYPVLDTIVGEMCDVFKSSPYFHIGGDEVQWEWFIDRPHVKEFMKKHNMRDKDKGGKDDLLKRHALRMNEIVKKYGKKTIFWAGYQGPPQVPELNDLIAYSWYTGARQALDAGFAIITVPWEIRGPWEKWNIYSCNADQLTRADKVLGGNRVAWEQSAEAYVNMCIYEAFRQEGTWGPDTVTESMAEITAREKMLGARLAKINRPVTIKGEGKVEGEQYSGKLNVTMTADPPAGCRIHYTTDGTEPTADSPVYEKPIQINGKLRLRAALFDESGQIVGGYTFAQKYNWKDFEQNLATGKPVKASGVAGQGKDAEVPENAVDGWVGNGTHWGAWDPPQWLQVDLQNVYNLDRVQIFPGDYGGRSFLYTIEVSTDEKNWTKVVDESANAKPESGQGHLHKFEPAKARYVRVNMLKNSIQNAVQLVELRVYEAEKPAPAGSSLQSNTLKADKRYLIFPRAKGVKGADKVFVRLDGELYFAEYDAVLAKSDPDFWTYIDLKLLQGKEVTVSAEGPNAEGIALVQMSDTIPGKYPLYHEPGRPQVHFSPVRGWLNDPSGMFYLNGKWHCYYMNTRFGNYMAGPNNNWSHAVSSDLLHWEEEPMLHTIIRGKQCYWTGSAAVDVENATGLGTPGHPAVVFACNHAFDVPNPFTQCIFVSTDEGLTAKVNPEMMYKALPKEDIRRGDGSRDAMIRWYAPDKKWVLVIYNKMQTPGAKQSFFFFESRDLKSWTETSVLEDMYECPNLFELPVDGEANKRLWVVWGASTEYRIGKFDGKTFSPVHEGKYKAHHGDYYASQVFDNAPGGRKVQIGWARVCNYETEFTQMASFPMDLRLRTTPQGPRLFAEFIPELAKLRDGGTSQKGVVVKAGTPLRLGDVSQPMELNLEFEPGAATQVRITGLQLTVRWNATSKELDVHGTKVTLSPQDGRVRLHLLLDIPSVEVVTNGGENYIIKGRNFAELREKSPLEISVEGGDVTFRRLEAYPLKSIQPGAPKQSAGIPSMGRLEMQTVILGLV